MFPGEIWLDFRERAALALPQVAAAAVVFLAFWIGAGLACRVILRMGLRRGLDPDLAQFLGRGAKVGLLLFGAVTALGTVGVDVAALVAGLGLTGFALGFALKDIVSNVVAGVLILMYRPFGRDDRISVGSFEGRVQDIDLRYTALDAGDRVIFVPNAKLFTDPVTVEKRAGSELAGRGP